MTNRAKKNRFTRYLRHYFTPNDRNNFRAKFLHIDSLAIMLVLAISISMTYNVILPKNLGDVLGVATEMSIDTLYNLTNQKRVENGLQPLEYNDKLAQAAVSKAQYMLANDLWAHYGRDGTTPWSFILNANYKYVYAGENLAKDFMNSGDVVTAWMQSPTHRENLLRADYEDIGFGVVNGNLGGSETTLVVQMFGTPQGVKVAPVVAAEPTLAPKPAEIAPQTVVAGAGATERSNLRLAAINLPYNATYAIFGLLLTSLLFDLYFARRLGLSQSVGKHGAHLIFVGFVLTSLYIISGGNII